MNKKKNKWKCFFDLLIIRPFTNEQGFLINILLPILIFLDYYESSLRFISILTKPVDCKNDQK